MLARAHDEPISAARARVGIAHVPAHRARDHKTLHQKTEAPLQPRAIIGHKAARRSVEAPAASVGELIEQQPVFVDGDELLESQQRAGEQQDAAQNRKRPIGPRLAIWATPPLECWQPGTGTG